MLSHYRILDLTDDRGHMAGFMLAQLGADVILAEPPGGHRHRHRGPFLGDRDPNGSIDFWSFNRGKRSVVIDDVDVLHQLAKSADAVLSCGVFDIDLDRLRQESPHLVTASISAFGLTGPKSTWAATDLIIAAASGTMSLTGDRDRPPVRIGEPQTWLNAGADAAGAVLLALHERQRSGRGQHVDVSAQQSFVDCTQFQMMAALVGAPIPERLPGAVKLGEFLIPWVYECADGHVTVTFLFGPMMGPFSGRLIKWMHAEGLCDQATSGKDWVDFGLAVFEGRETIESFDWAIKQLATFIRTKTKAELLERALADNLLIAPITTTGDVLALPQLADRQYWQTIDVGAPSGERPRFTGPFAKTSGPALDASLPAPSLGQDTVVIAEQLRHQRSGAAMEPQADPTARPLDGVKILDFMWALAGPGATRTLADYGATVVKIESEGKADVLRGVNPFIGEQGGQENALQFHSLNANKLGLTLDLSLPEARDVVFDLVRWCDVLTESFSPKAMANWGFGYEDLKEINPNLVMFSSCLMGQTGPMRMYAGFGTMAAAIAGFYPITGWPDRIPAGPFTAYTDYISPRASVAVILAALEHRRFTGEGQHIDFSQLEAALQYLGPALLDQEINGVTAGRNGNADHHSFPHGVFPAAGNDRWVALVCESDDQWQSLARVLGADALVDLDVAARRHRAAEIDELISGWTRALAPSEAQDRLQAVGVAAHMVNNAADLIADPQILHRQHFLSVPHIIHGSTWVEAASFTLSRTPARVDWGGPMFGQHNMEVLEGLLGYDGDRIADLVIAGAIA